MGPRARCARSRMWIQSDGTIAIALMGRRRLVAAVDFCDLEKVVGRAWYAKVGPLGHTYATTRLESCDRQFPLHRLILASRPGEHVDHVNGDGLDNRRSNLRRATIQQNAANRKFKKSKSPFKGVYRTRHGRYRAVVRKNGRCLHLGVFSDALQAAAAYNAAAIREFGEFAYLNPVS